jgi:TonB family protein
MSKKEKRNRDFVYKPFYEGGKQALDNFISSNIKYPQEAIDNNIQGTVKLLFEIDFKGNVSNAKVTAGLGFGCDEEAIRLVELLKYEVPKTYKLKVSFKKKLSIHFRYQKETKPIKPAVTSYVYSTSAPTKSKSTSYSYQIKIK